MQGMLNILKYVEARHGVNIYQRVLRDIGNYSYPVLAIQANKPLSVFWGYARRLGQMGLGVSGMFYFYWALLIVLRPQWIDRVIAFLKRRFGFTPVIGKVYRGRSE
jgi:hypothetical protein